MAKVQAKKQASRQPGIVFIGEAEQSTANAVVERDPQRVYAAIRVVRSAAELRAAKLTLGWPRNSKDAILWKHDASRRGRSSQTPPPNNALSSAPA